MAIYRGSCHCGAIRFEVEGEIDDVSVCNCSICTRTAYLHWEVEPAQFRLLTGEEAIRNYQFGTMTSKNYFCGHCGISAFRRSRSDPDKVDVNLRCVEGIDVESIRVQKFDGRNWESTMDRRGDSSALER
ncbi:MAG TPA: GFA family protein [Myxococcota bacterium]|nr:GFA family protein [Myxococcota bacterium]